MPRLPLLTIAALAALCFASSAAAGEFRYNHLETTGLTDAVVDAFGKDTTVVFTRDSDQDVLAVLYAVIGPGRSGYAAPENLSSVPFDQQILLTGEFTSGEKRTPLVPASRVSEPYRDFKVTGLKVVFPFYERVAASAGSEINGPWLFHAYLSFKTLLPDGVKSAAGKQINLTKYTRQAGSALPEARSVEPQKSAAGENAPAAMASPALAAGEFRYYHADSLTRPDAVIDNAGTDTAVRITDDGDKAALAVLHATLTQAFGTWSVWDLSGVPFDQQILLTGTFVSGEKTESRGPACPSPEPYRDFKVTGIKVVFPFYERGTSGHGDAMEYTDLVRVHFGFDTLLPKGVKTEDRRTVDLTKYSARSQSGPGSPPPNSGSGGK